MKKETQRCHSHGSGNPKHLGCYSGSVERSFQHVLVADLVLRGGNPKREEDMFKVMGCPIKTLGHDSNGRNSLHSECHSGMFLSRNPVWEGVPFKVPGCPITTLGHDNTGGNPDREVQYFQVMGCPIKAFGHDSIVKEKM